jgi:hypothetical protein
MRGEKRRKPDPLGFWKLYLPQVFSEKLISYLSALATFQPQSIKFSGNYI